MVNSILLSLGDESTGAVEMLVRLFGMALGKVEAGVFEMDVVTAVIAPAAVERRSLCPKQRPS